MEAEYFEKADGSKEIKLENGVQYFAKPEEPKETFIERVTESIERDYIEDLSIVDEHTETPAVLKPVKAAEPEDQEPERGASHDTVVTDEASSVETRGRKPIERPPLEEVKQLAEEAKENIGIVVSFIPFRCLEPETGEIVNVVLDKRVRQVYYKILSSDGLESQKKIDDDTIKFDLGATKELKAKREKEAKELAAKKKAEAEARKQERKAAKAKKREQREEARKIQAQQREEERKQKLAENQRLRREKANGTNED